MLPSALWALVCLAASVASEVHGPPPRRDLDLRPPRKPQFATVHKQHGDGFLRMPVKRQRVERKGKGKGVGRPKPPKHGGPGTARPPPPVPSWNRTITKATYISNTTKTNPHVPRDWGWSHLEDYEGLSYMIELNIGSPPQKVTVAVDTGSYELWVNPKCVASPNQALCQKYGQYTPKDSKSSSYLGGNFHIIYGTGQALGNYYQDTMKVAMFQVPGTQFAVASHTDYVYSGVLGLGYGYPFTTQYPTLLTLLWAYGNIGAPIFSLGLGGEGDGHSEIIFGGVNRWKYSGYLEPVPIWPPIEQQDPHWPQYWVNVSSIGMSPPGKPRVVFTTLDTFSMPMLIDSGSTLSYIREDIVAVIGQQLRAAVDENNHYWVDCELRNQPGTIDFGFNRGRMVVTVSYRDFIWEQYPGHCLMGFQPADVGTTNYVLGDTFIRGAYLVFDQQSDVVWMADYYNCGDGVITVGAAPADTQFVKGVC